MTAEEFAEWLSPLSMSERIRALAFVYSELTIGARQLFLPEHKGKQLAVLGILQGINEIHHTLSGALVAYATNGRYQHSLEGLGRMLLDNARKFHAEDFLEPAFNFARGKGKRGQLGAGINREKDDSLN